MGMGSIFEVIDILAAHFYDRPEDAVGQWTSILCDDYQVPIACIFGFFENAVPPNPHSHRVLRSCPNHLAVIQIIQNSALSQVLQVSNQAISYRPKVPLATRKEIAQYINSKPGTIAD